MRTWTAAMRPGLAAALLVLSPAGLRAQQSRTGGVLEGTVLDPSGAAVAGATVGVVETDTAAAREAVTDGSGRWQVSELAVGAYRVTVEASGFAPAIREGVRVLVGRSSRLDVQLSAARASATVTVVADASALDRSSTAPAVSVENERILELPVRARDALAFVLLAPGVVAAPPAATGAAALGDSGFSSAGLRPRSNAFTIDGVDNTEEYTGGPRTALSLEIVREFQVVETGISAEAGGASGGSVNVITKSGTNTWHGDAFALGRAGGPGTRWRAGGALNGPLIRDRTFVAAAAEQEHAREPAPAPPDPATVRDVDAVLSLPFLSGLGRPQRSAARAGNEETEASARFDHHLTGTHAAMLRYSYFADRRTGDAFGADPLTDPSARGSSFVADHALVASLASNRRSFVNDLRMQAAWRRVRLRTGDTSGPGVVIPGRLRFGRPWEGNQERSERRLQVSDALTFARGRHLLKTGLALGHVVVDGTHRDGSGGLYTFASLLDLAAGQPDQYRQAFAAADLRLPATAFGVYVNDRFALSRSLVLEAGLRYDVEALPAGVPRDRDDFSPRVGLALSPTPELALRIWAGRFHDRQVLAALDRPLREDGTRGFEQVLDGPQAAAVLGRFPGAVLPVPLAGAPISRYELDRGLQTPFADHLGLSVERLLTQDLTARIGFLVVHGGDQQRTRNVGPGETARDVFRVESSARSRYQGVSVFLNRRFAREMAWSASYTLSRARDDASDFDEQPRDPRDLPAEWSWSRYDQRHRFVFNGLFDVLEIEEARPGEDGRTAHPSLARQLLGQWELAPTLAIGSGRPVNPAVGLDLERTHANPPASRFGARNSLRTPATVDLDLRIVKYLALGRHGKLDLVADIFNVLNRDNVLGLDPLAARSAAPLRGALRSPGRAVHLTVDFEF